MLPLILQKVKAMGFAVFADSGHDYDLNIIGIRSSARLAGAFDDQIQVWYQLGGQWHGHAWPVTCDPGVPWLEDGNAKGTAILVEGQYCAGWKIGRHRGKYEALVQNTEVSVYRDGNKDRTLDLDSPIETGRFGIHIHKAGRNSSAVGRWSAGCQVFKRAEDFEAFMKLCKLQASVNGWDSYTYTLILEEQC